MAALETRRHRVRKPADHAPSADSQQADPLYTPLDQGQSEIRIVTLHANDDKGAPLKCTVEVAPLGSAGDFIALSYCCGAPGDSRVVTVSGKDVPVQVNLWTCLRNLRSLRGQARVWVDYLCINQSDYREKGPQVKLMADVFRAATAVYASLGEGTAEIDIALANHKTAIQRLEQGSGDCLEIYNTAQRDLLRLLADSEYWTRIWIIQEVLHARSLWLMVGASLIPWKPLEGLRILDKGFTLILSDGGTAANAFLQIWDYRRGKNARMTLKYLVQDFHKSQCHDPRDRIYGMLGMLTPFERSRGCVDYTVSLLQAVVNNFKILMPETGNGTDPGLFDSIIWSILNNVLPEEVEVHGQVIRFSCFPQLQKALTLRGEVSRSARHTVAALRVNEHGFVNLTQENVSQQFDVYVTLLSQAGPDFSLLSSIELYSTILPQREDLIVSLGMSYLIVRWHREVFRVVGTAIDSKCAYPRRYASGRYIDPQAWAKTIIPEAKFTLLGSPIASKAFGWNTCDWMVRLDGAALAQLAIVPSLKPGSVLCLENASYTAIQSVSQAQWQSATAIVTRYEPRDLPISTSIAAANMLPIYLQNPTFLPGLYRESRR